MAPDVGSKVVVGTEENVEMTLEKLSDLPRRISVVNNSVVCISKLMTFTSVYHLEKPST